MTDEQLITALERCFQHKECCWCNSLEECGSKKALTDSAINLINRQKAEIEKLQAEKEAMFDTIHKLGNDYAEALEKESD